MLLGNPQDTLGAACLLQPGAFGRGVRRSRRRPVRRCDPQAPHFLHGKGRSLSGEHRDQLARSHRPATTRPADQHPDGRWHTGRPPHRCQRRHRPGSGQVQILLDIQQAPSALRRSVSTWLLQALAHEVDHSVRIEAGPGCWPTLLDQRICEGMSSAFDIQVEPTIQLPWFRALTACQETAMWSRAHPLLNKTGLYDSGSLAAEASLT